MARNKTGFICCRYLQREPILDKNGFYTGEYQSSYERPMYLTGVISTAKNQDNIQTFGVDLDYDKTIVVDDPLLPINEYSAIFIDGCPVWDETTGFISNTEYIVVKIARSLNVLSIAVKKVNTNVEK